MHPIDWAIIAVYLVWMVWDGLRLTTRSHELEGFFLGGRQIPWWAVGLSVMATQLSAITMIGTTGQGYADGMRFLQFYFGLPVAMVILSLTLVPFFSKIGDVQEFTFSGKTTTKSGTNVKDPSSNSSTVQDNVEVTKEGTTVQLPTFAFTTVSTTVSVPDGGTVLLGGIKRLFEARSERGVPMLNKIPYVNRLFKNVGIGRETSSLMLMVTPRIIIQEEEEAKLGIDITP